MYYCKTVMLNFAVSIDIPVETGDYGLDVSYYNFDKTHNDFAYDNATSYSKPIYVASPYGGWLAISDTPTCNSFSDWFRSVPVFNRVVESKLVLKYNAAEQVNRFAEFAVSSCSVPRKLVVFLHSFTKGGIFLGMPKL